MRVPVRMGVFMRVAGRLTMAGVLMIMLVVMLVMLFMFHQVRIPSMLECLHAPQRRE